MDGLFDFSALFFGDKSNKKSTPLKKTKIKQNFTPSKSSTTSAHFDLKSKLDITYLEDDLIAVGQPWVNRTEKEAKRNNVIELCNFLDEKYDDKILALNLSNMNKRGVESKTVEYRHFKWQVLECDLEKRFNLHALFLLCHAVRFWLDYDDSKDLKNDKTITKQDKNVLVVFCKNSLASRIFLSTFLTFRGRFQNIYRALEYFYLKRVDVSVSADDILAKANMPSIRHWVDKVQMIMDGESEIDLYQVKPISLFMVLIDNLPVTTATGVLEPNFFSFLGPSDEDLENAEQPIFNIYELGVNRRQLIYSTSSETDSTVHYDAKEGKLVLKCNKILIGDIELECVFARNTARPLFRYYLHTSFFSGNNGIYDVPGCQLDSSYRNVIDSDFKVELVLQSTGQNELKNLTKSQNKRMKDSYITKSKLDAVGLEGLTKLHFLSPDKNLCNHLQKLTGSKNKNRINFALQRSNNSLDEALRYLKLDPIVLNDMKNASTHFNKDSSNKIINATNTKLENQENIQTLNLDSSDLLTEEASLQFENIITKDSDKDSPLQLKEDEDKSQKEKKIFSSPLRHYNRRFLVKEKSNSNTKDANSKCMISPYKSSIEKMKKNKTQKTIEEKCDGNQEDEDVDADWDRLLAEIESECNTFVSCNKTDKKKEPNAISNSLQIISSKNNSNSFSTVNVDSSSFNKINDCKNCSTKVIRSSVAAKNENLSSIDESIVLNRIENDKSEKCSNTNECLLPPPPPIFTSINNSFKNEKNTMNNDNKNDDKIKASNIITLPPQIEKVDILKETDFSSSISTPTKAINDSKNLDRFRKMIKVGIPNQVVKQKMVFEGLNPTSIGLTPETNQHSEKKNLPTSPSSEEKNTNEYKMPTKMGKEYDKFRKMLKLGIPKDAVRNKIILEGLNPEVLFPEEKESSQQAILNTPSPNLQKIRRKKVFWVAIPENKVKKNSIWSVSKNSFKVRKESRRSSFESVCSTCSSPSREGGLISPNRLLQDGASDMQELESLFFQKDPSNSKYDVKKLKKKKKTGANSTFRL